MFVEMRFPSARFRGHWAYAGLVGQVLVPAVGEADGAAGVVEAALDRLPLVSGGPLDGDWAVRAMEVAALRVGFEAAVVWEHLLPGPLVVPHRDPVLEVARDATEGDGAVHRGRAAGDLAAVKVDLAAGDGCRLESPVVVPP